MKWVTRHHVKVDRVACPWLIARFIDEKPEFLFVAPDEVDEVARREGAIPFDVPGVELGHEGKRCSFDAFIRKYRLECDPALVLLAKIVNGADTDNSLWDQPEAAGLKAVADGFARLGLADDHQILAREFPVYDALHAYCRNAVATGKPDGLFR
jgi:hypothetical protein